MKYISLIIICTLLLGASGDSERPKGWSQVQSVLTERDYKLLGDVIGAYQKAFAAAAVDAGGLPRPVNFQRLAELLEGLANEPEFTTRLAGILHGLQGAEGHRFFAVVRDALDEARLGNRELFMSAIDSSNTKWWLENWLSAKSVKGFLTRYIIPNSGCALYVGWDAVHDHSALFAQHVCRFGSTQLKQDLDWLEDKAKAIRVQLLQHEIEQLKKHNHSQEDIHAVEAEKADAEHGVPPWLRNPEKYAREIAVFQMLEPSTVYAPGHMEFSPEAKLPEIISVLLKIARHYAGDVTEEELADKIKKFILDDQNGVAAVLKYAQG